MTEQIVKAGVSLNNVDQLVSATAKLTFDIDGEQFAQMISVRNGATVEQVTAVAMNLVEAFSKLRATYPKPERIVPDPSEPKRVDVDENGNEIQEPKVFIASEMVVDLHEGKIFTKVKGKPFEKFGVPIWPEVLEACNIEVKIGEPVPDIAGWTAKYIEKDGKDGKRTPSKVIALLPPKKARRQSNDEENPLGYTREGQA